MPSDINEIFQSFLLSMVNEKNASLIKGLHVRWRAHLSQPIAQFKSKDLLDVWEHTDMAKPTQLSGTMVTLEECKRRERDAFLSAKQLGEAKYDVSAQLVLYQFVYPTYEDYQQSLKQL